MHRMSCSPRPNVSQLRPSQSIFHLSTLIPILGQALIHILIMSQGAKILPGLSGDASSYHHKRLSIRFSNAGSNNLSSGRNSNSVHSLIPRERFRPNLSTNVVFILSIFQNAIIALTNHLGSPYQEDILECRSVIIWGAGSMFFCIILVTEVFPLLNRALELAPWPSKRVQIAIIILLALDGIVSLCFRCLTRTLDRNRKYVREEVVVATGKTAADYEVQTLAKERVRNTRLLWSLFMLLVTLTLKGIF